ncbi:autotransporter assembly complex protein TamB [Candidatus Hartigia pinicola]
MEKKNLTLAPADITDLRVHIPGMDDKINRMGKLISEIKVTVREEKFIGVILKEFFSQPLLARLPEVILPINVHAEEINISDLKLTGFIKLTINRLTFSISNDNQNVLLKQFKLNTPGGNIVGSGTIILKDKWPIFLLATGESFFTNFDRQNIDILLKGVLLEKLQLGLNLSGRINATLNVKTNLGQADLPVQLMLKSSKIKWAFVSDAHYQFDDICLLLNGRPSAYTLSLRSVVHGQKIPASTLMLNAKGNEERIYLTRLRLTSLQGNVNITGVADWKRGINWNAVLTLSGINTAKYWPEWPAKADGKIATRGSWYCGSWKLHITEIFLDGKIKNNYWKARGQVKGNAEGLWEIPEFTLSLGNNYFNVKGNLADNWHLDTKINALNLNDILPGLGGMIIGEIKLRGNLMAPQVLTDLTIRGVRWQKDFYLDHAIIKGQVASSEKIKSDLSIIVRQLKQADLVINNLTLNATGTEKQHSVKLNIQGEPVSGHLTLLGMFNRQDKTWTGNIYDTLFKTLVGELYLSNIMTLNYSHLSKEFTIEPHCWMNTNVRFCVPQPIKANKNGRANIAFKRFDLAILKPFLSDAIQLRGVFNGQANFIWKDNGALLDVKINLKNNNLKDIQLIQGTQLPFKFEKVTLSIVLRNSKLNLDWLFKIANHGQMKGNIQVCNFAKPGQISGNIEFNAITLALIQPFLGNTSIVNGNLNANIRLHGTVRNPLLYGKLFLSKVEIKSIIMPFYIKSGNLDIIFNGSTSVINGQINTPEGYLKINGGANWRNINAWRAKVMIFGSNLRVSMSPIMKIDLQPNIMCEISSTLLTLDGSITIPWARITIQELPEATVSTSPDVVMLDSNLQPLNKISHQMLMQTNLEVKIGNDIKVDALGLTASVTGMLKVLQNQHGLAVNGQIDIPSGRFRAYGQDLIIRKGQIQFSGSVDQPFLNLEAIRNPDNTADSVVAGIKVTGLLDKPKVEIFSEPIKTQQEVLSYLLHGEGLESEDANGAQITSMIIRLGVAQSGQFVGKIGAKFGVSDLILHTQGVGDKSQVVVSGKITNDLQIKYGVGIFDSLATLTLRYRLMPKLYLEAVSGPNQAIDLLYQFEF